MLSKLFLTLFTFLNLTSNTMPNMNECDPNIKPEENFYKFVNNPWLQTTTIPDDKPAWGNFAILAEQNALRIKDLIEELEHSDKRSVAQQKLLMLYKSGMDTNRINAKGEAPLQNWLAQIEDIHTKSELLDFISKSYRWGLGFWLGHGVYADSKNPSINVIHFFQDGLSLPDKDYYLREEPEYATIKRAYEAYIVNLFMLLGTDQQTATRNAQTILVLETAIARSHRAQEELRDPELNYNAFSPETLYKEVPELPWEHLFSNMEINPKKIIVAQPEYYKALANLVEHESLEALKTKLKFDLVNGHASLLSESFQREHFNFFDRKLKGLAQEPKRWKKMVNLTNSLMGDAVGEIFVNKYFPKAAKAQMEDLIRHLRSAYLARIQKLTWMELETKKRAAKKLESMTYQIGYPKKFKQYETVSLRDGDFFENVLELYRYHYDYEINKIDQVVDPNEWAMPAATVNAYYSPLRNQIVFPAGILQPPFFDFKRNVAENYGAIGVVIGHEMTHGFDDQGRKYDETCRLNNWWTDNDVDNFKERTKVFVEQFNKCEINGRHVNGRLTLGENIADLGGLQISLNALHLALKAYEYDLREIKAFFISYARMWRMLNRDEYMALRLKIDPHAPEELRVNVPLSNMHEFHEAFSIEPGSAMHVEKTKRAYLW